MYAATRFQGAHPAPQAPPLALPIVRVLLGFVCVMFIYILWLQDSRSDGKFHLKDMRVLRPRGAGRSGNLLYEYTVFRLLAMRFKKRFECEYALPAPFSMAPRTVPASAYEDLDLSTLEDGEVLPPYYFYYPWLMGRRRVVQDEIFPTVNVTSKKYDIAIHIRLGDAVSRPHPEYTALLPDFYKRVFARLVQEGKASKHSSILVMIADADPPEQRLVLDATAALARQLTGSTNVVKVAGRNVSEDWTDLMSSRIVVASVGTFWMIPTFVSRVVREVHVPMYGRTREMNVEPSSAPEDEYTVVKYHDIPRVTDVAKLVHAWGTYLL